jgi:hypothetical protein
MFIRHLIGPRKGEVEDIIFDRAKAKVLAGEAEDVYNQLNLPQADVAQPEVVSERADSVDAVAARHTQKKAKKRG